LTGNIKSTADGIVVERDNIIIDGAGYTLQGSRSLQSKGIDLTERSNVTIKNIRISLFYYGIRLYGSSNSIITGNNIANNGWHMA
jgi:parallel beta-helix repeat protein